MKKSLRDLVYEHECHLQNKDENIHVLYCFDAVQLLKQVRKNTIRECMDKLENDPDYWYAASLLQNLSENEIQI